MLWRRVETRGKECWEEGRVAISNRLIRQSLTGEDDSGLRPEGIYEDILERDNF